MLKNDPEISVSEPCTDVLELVIELLDRAWHHHDLQTIISPMQKHFDGVKAKEANEKLKEKREKERNLHYDFLDEQKDITNTVLLATRLRKKILIDSIRGSEDTVRDWKKLRSPSKT